MRAGLVSVAVAMLASNAVPAQAQKAPGDEHQRSIAIEADAIAYGISGYSGILSMSLRNGLQFAIGTGRYELPGFLLEGDSNYDAAQWKSTSTSVQVFRMTYRFRGAMKSGPAAGVVALNQHFRLSSQPLDGETDYRTLSVGLTAGYYIHFGKHFYVYPTVAFTGNTVYSGSTKVKDTPYTVEKFGPNGSVHVGWEWAR